MCINALHNGLHNPFALSLFELAVGLLDCALQDSRWFTGISQRFCWLLLCQTLFSTPCGGVGV
jgi:hypothetical protein